MYFHVLAWKCFCSRIKELELVLVKLQAKIENDAGIEITRFVRFLPSFHVSLYLFLSYSVALLFKRHRNSLYTLIKRLFLKKFWRWHRFVIFWTINGIKIVLSYSTLGLDIIKSRWSSENLGDFVDILFRLCVHTVKWNHATKWTANSSGEFVICLVLNYLVFS